MLTIFLTVKRDDKMASLSIFISMLLHTSTSVHFRNVTVFTPLHLADSFSCLLFLRFRFYALNKGRSYKFVAVLYN